MNIFYLSDDVDDCARQHCDKHVVKMILEYAQLLSTAHRVLDGTEGIRLSAAGRKLKDWRLPDPRDELLYRATHINHPCAIWARYSKPNYEYLWALLHATCLEYTYRYGKHHKVERDGILMALAEFPYNLTKTEWCQPARAMPDEYKVEDVIQSYRNYYNGGKSHLFSWKLRPTPEWIQNDNAI